jgi:ABC-type glycerol-3-phosphate transport system permease component
MSHRLVSLILYALALLSLTPFLWLLCASVKQGDDFFTYTFLPWHDPGRWTLANYARLVREHPFATWLLNSLLLSCAQTVIVVTLSTLGGFALAKYRFRFKQPLMLMMLLTMLIPHQVLLPSLQLMMYHAGWINSFAAILVPGAVSVFGVLLFMQSMKLVPDELLAAARADGCSELRLWWEVALPIVRPMIGAYTLMSFMANWNGFLWPQIVLQDEHKYTLPIGLANMMGQPEFQTPSGVLMAGTLVSILPVVVLFFVLQRDFIAGLTSGAVKG